MGAVAHGECPACGSRAPVDLAAHVMQLEAALEMVLSVRMLDNLTSKQWLVINSVRGRTAVK